MPIDRKFWRGYWFTHHYTPSWPCPTCNRGMLRVVQDTLHQIDNSETRRNRSNQEWFHEYDRGVFSCLMQCSNESCDDVVSVSGRSSTGEEGKYGEPVTCFSPHMFTPPLNLLIIPAECPEDVAKEFREAFNLFWCDLAGGMNHLRKAVELILDRLKIKRQTKNKSGKMVRIELHARIAIFRAKDKKNVDLADRLEAVKWLGNVGSHSSDVTQNEFFNACDLLEDFIQTHFEKRGAKIVALTKTIIKRKGK